MYIVWETSKDNILRFLAISNFLNQQKGRGSLSVRKMNLRSHKTSVSIVTQAICTGNFNQFLKPILVKHYKCSILSHIPECKIFNIKVAKLRTGVGSAETSYLQNCSVKLFKEHFKVQICKGRLFEKNKIIFFSNFRQLISSSSSIS